MRSRIARCPTVVCCTASVLFAATSSLMAQQDGFAPRLDDYLRHQASPPFSGVVLVARDTGVLFERGYGLADADLGVPNTSNLRYGLGSLTKPVTAAAAMRLVERGVLQLDAPICRYLRECPPAWQPVTLRHLLSHESGIPDLFNALPAARVDSTRAVMDAAIHRRLGDSLRFAPGTKYEYSNFNYFLVAYAMEVATGSLWESILQSTVFAPAGMTQTRYDDVWAIIPGRARGYRRVGGELRNIAYHDHAAYAAGGLLSTVEDLLAFERALRSGRIVADSTFRLMTTPKLGNYGLGWQITTSFGRRVQQHLGDTNGFASNIARFEDGVTIVVLSNVEGAAAVKGAACDIAAIVLGLRVSNRAAGEPACRTDTN